MPSILYRAYRATDLPFVLKSWIRSYARSSYAGPYDHEILPKAIKATILKLIARQSVKLVIVSNSDNPDQIWGFVCYQTNQEYPILHFLYVKELFRGMGLGLGMVALAKENKHGFLRYTFRTQACNKFLAQDARYRPHLARKETYESQARNPNEESNDNVHRETTT